MQSKLISVIIPIYNVEKYIEECINSVINQTYKNLEILCIDDCGIDNSIKIVESFAKKDEKIKIIKHNTNKGLSGARNTGLNNATGEFIYFIDSDDFIDLDYLKNMVKCIEENNVQIVINNNIIEYYSEDNKKNKQFWWKSFDDGIYNINNNKLSTLPVMSWCKLYKKSFLDNINAKFPEGLKYEDNYFDATTLIYCDKIYITNTTTYYYRQRNDSIIGKNKAVLQSLDMIYIIKNIYHYYKEKNVLNKFKINILNIKDHLNKYFDKEEYFQNAKDLFKLMKNDIINNKELYNNDEILFFNNMLKATNYTYFVENKKKENKLKTFKKMFINIICAFIFNEKKRKDFRNKLLTK